MELLEAPFAAGSLTWVRYGRSYQPRRFYEQAKITVMLGTTPAGWRSSRQHPWRKVPARSTCVCLADVGDEAELTGDGQLFALFVEKDYLGGPGAMTSHAEHDHHGVYGAHDPYLFHLAVEATARLRREQTLSPRYVESVALLASVHIRERYLQRKPPTQVRPEATLAPHAEVKVLAYIRAHLNEGLPLADLAKVAGISTSHFARAFRKSVGETPHRFIVRHRLEHARELLLTGGGKMSLGEAAYQTGFSSQSHFSRCFRAWCGLTPGEFLRKERLGSARM